MIIKNVLNLKNDFKYVDFVDGELKINNPYIVPNVSAIAREMTGSSQIVMIIKRFLALKFGDKVKFGFNNLSFVMSLLKKDFATGVKVLCELEILKVREENDVSHFVLHNQMVDMAVAFNNKNLLKNFLFLAEKYNFVPGIITYNIEPTIKYLSNSPKLSTNLVIYTPLNQIKDNSVLEYLNSSILKIIDIKE